jgi:hypothetical protein
MNLPAIARTRLKMTCRLQSKGLRLARARFYENLEQIRRGVDAVGWEVCYAMIEGASQTRRGDDNASVIFGEEAVIDI